MNTFLQSPRLIEPGVRYFLSGTLKECRKFKDNHFNAFFNIYMLLIKERKFCILSSSPAHYLLLVLLYLTFYFLPF